MSSKQSNDNDSIIADTIVNAYSSSQSKHNLPHSATQTYYVYNTHLSDQFHTPNTFYYPLYLKKIPNAVRFRFAQHPGMSFWMPNEHDNRTVGGLMPPESILEYIYYTNTGSNYTFEMGNLNVSMIDIADDLTESVPHYDMVVEINWKRSSRHDWLKVFQFKSDATVFEDIYNKNIQYITEPQQWLPCDLSTTLSNDYLKHIAKCLFNDEEFHILIQNKENICEQMKKCDTNEHIQNCLYCSKVNAESGMTDATVLPACVLSQLTHNSKYGHARLRTLFEKRNYDTTQQMSLLQKEDRIIFTITICPPNKGVVKGFQNIVTSKTYKIMIKLYD